MTSKSPDAEIPVAADGLSSVARRIRKLVRPNLHQIKPYVPGRPLEDVQREFGLSDVVKLASNENATGPSPKALAAIQGMLDDLNRYPDGAALDLRSAIAGHVKLTPAHVLVGNGSDELIKMISETFLQPGDEVITALPSFVQYHFGALVMGAEIIEVPMADGFQYDLEGMLKRVTGRTKIIYLCTPNNPTGTWLTHTEVAKFLDLVPENVLVICDEAYVEYVDAPDPLQSLEFVKAGRAVVSLRTFSKMYGLAGMRLGYALADPGIISFINQVREPFNANAVAQAGAAAALSDDAHVKRSREANRLGREQYYAGLSRLRIPYIKTQGNFLLAKVGDGPHVFEELQKRGVIVRAGFKSLDEYVRISIGTEAENARCLQELAVIMGR